MKYVDGVGWEMDSGALAFDGWTPEIALAVVGVLRGMESVIWERYGDAMLPLMLCADEADEPQPEDDWMDLQEDLPF